MREISERDVEIARTIAYAYCKKVGLRDCDDVVGDALEGLARAARDFDETKGSWGSYAYTRVFGAILDAGRRTGRQTRGQHKAKVDVPAPLHFDNKLLEALQGDGSMEDQVANLHLIREAFRKLTKRERLVFWAHYVVGYSQREIAAWLSLTEARISQVLSEAKEKLS